VLAVGDAQFQKKCLGKMEDVSRQGRTVLFVSHNMSAIEMLCTRALLLEAGHLQLDDAAPAVVKHYLDLSYSLPQGRLAERTDRKGNGVVRAVNFRIFDESGAEQTSVQSGRDYIFEVEYENRGSDRIDNVALSIDFFDERNIRILLFRSSFDAQNVAINPRRGRIRCAVKNLPLANGLYRISLYLSAREDTELLDWIEDAALLTVSGGDFFETGSQGFPPLCKVLVKASWSSI
jgi:lipopolysaccharide transport system ATP-binding protein